MAAIHLYCDEAGKFQKSDYTSFGGYIQAAIAWEKFSEEWNGIRAYYEVPPIHMSAIAHPEDNPEWMKVKERWEDKWKDTCKEMLSLFATKVHEHQLICVCAVVDSTHFRSMPDSPFKTKVEDTKYLAFQDVVLRSIDDVRWGNGDYAIGLVLDDDEETATICYSLLAKLKKIRPEIQKRISGICFIEDSRYPGVQAADMVTYEARKYMVSQLGGSPEKPSSLLVSLCGFDDRRPVLYTAEILDKMAAMRDE